MSDCLVLSKNRPAQLDLLLASIDRYAHDVFDTVTILYTYDSPEYAQAYQYVRQDWPLLVESAPRPHRIWQLEGDFEGDIRVWLEETGDVVTFLTDDAVFFRPAERPYHSAIHPNMLLLPYAYRTSDAYNWKVADQHKEHSDWFERAYPLTIVGTTYSKDTIMPLLDFGFPNPTALEAGMAARAARFEPDWIYGAAQSLCLIQANRVSAGSNMPHMGIDPLKLNRRYLDGERLDLDGMDFEGVTTCHSPIPFAWRSIVPEPQEGSGQALPEPWDGSGQ